MTEGAANADDEGNGWNKIISSLFLALAAAVIGYIFSYLDDQRKEKIHFVNAQIEKLYGPLFSIMQANDIAWNHFHKNYWPDRKDYFPENIRLSPNEVELYRRWMRAVFQPMNIKMENAIVNNSQLLVGNRMPNVFLQFISHTEAYKAVMANWKDGAVITEADTAPALNIAPISWPEAFSSCVSAQFHMLKDTQQMLGKQFVSWPGDLDQQTPTQCLVYTNLQQL